MNRPLTLIVTIVLLAAAGVLIWRTRLSVAPALPYVDSFAGGRMDEWQAYGGVWAVSDGTITNSSDERGAKVITGSQDWKDYVVEAEVKLAANDSDAGLIADASQEELGVDSYSGYYAGLRTRDNSLVLGRADHIWDEYAAVPLPGGVDPSTWYLITLTNRNCIVRATASNPLTGGSSTIVRRTSPCLDHGRVGLRSYSTGGAWRHVRVRTITDSLDTLDQGLSSVPSASAGMNAVFRSTPFLNVSDATTQEIVAIRDLMLQGRSRNVTIHGTVTLTSPALYVDDGSGGVRVESEKMPSLRVGDEVEVVGTIRREHFNVAIQQANIKFLWSGDLRPPISISASQAAAGTAAARYIQTEGVLVSTETIDEHSYRLTAESGGHTFRALLTAGSADVRAPSFPRNSLVRFQGICSTDAIVTGGDVPFGLLLRSAQDLQLIKGPPWWLDWHLPAYSIGAVLALLMTYVLILRLRQSQLHAVLEERGRFAGEIHDTMAQSFAGIEFQLRAIRRTLSTGTREQLAAHVDLASQMVRHSHDEARRNITVLRPETLSELDLLSHLRIGADHLVSAGNVQVEARSTGEPLPLPLYIKDAALRIGLEALANAVRHGQPSRIVLAVEYDSRVFKLSVADNGCGFDPGIVGAGFGLLGMRTRAKRIGATLSVSSVQGSGTTVLLTAYLHKHRRPRIVQLFLRKAGIEVRSHV